MISPDLEQRIATMLKVILSQANDNPELYEGVIWNSIRIEVEGILKEMNTPEVVKEEEYDVIDLKAFYMVDRDNEEDVKWEGLKQNKAFEDISTKIMVLKAYDTVKTSKEGIEKHQFEVKVLKRKV